MPYTVIYKDTQRSWGQHHLGDYCPQVVIQNKNLLDAIDEGKWKQKKSRHSSKKNAGISVKPLRRGRKPVLYPQQETYYMNIPRDVARVRRYKWFTSCWNHQTPKPSVTSFIPLIQTSLLDLIPHILNAPAHSTKSSNNGLNKPIYTPHFHEPRYIQKEEYCRFMASWAWKACRSPSKKVGQVSHVFYLNDFSFFDSDHLLEQIRWGKSSILPSDIIRLELYRRLQGFETFKDYFRMIQIAPNIMDHIGIKMTHSIPSFHRYTGYLKQIGLEMFQKYFRSLVNEARSLGLIKDKVHIWDGQFHESWLQKDKGRKQGLPQFFGGTYNHGGSKVGVGVYQSTIVDWNGYCTIPIYSELVPANRNENPVVIEALNTAYQVNPVSDLFLADRGPSGKKVQEKCAQLGARPIIPLTSNPVTDVFITQEKKHRFYLKFIGNASGKWLEKIYNIRPRIEQHYNLNDTVYNLVRLHGCGEELMKIEICIGNCLAVLIPLTAYKIGRPDLMWSPSCFKEQTIHPERLFPQQFRELNDFRWDDEICVNPIRYRARIIRMMKEYQNSKNL